MNKTLIAGLLLCGSPAIGRGQVLNTDSTEVVNIVGALPAGAKLFKAQQQFPLQSADDLLARTVGLQVIKRGNFAWEALLRGLNPGQFNTTLGGMHIFGACTDHMDPATAYVETNNLSAIQLNTVPGMGISGASLGGSLDLQLSQPLFYDHYMVHGAGIMTAQSNGGEVNPQLALNIGSRKWALLASGSYRASGDYTDGAGNKVDFSHYHKWNGRLAAAYRLSSRQTVTLDWIHDHAFDVGYPALTMDVGFATADIVSLTHHYHFRHTEGETKVYFNHINHAMDDTHRPDDKVAMHMDMPGTSTTGGFYSVWSMHDPKTGNLLKINADGYYNRLMASMTMYPTGQIPMFMYTVPEAARFMGGIGITDSYPVNDRLEVTGSFRAEWQHSYLWGEEGKQQAGGMFGGVSATDKLLVNAHVDILWHYARQQQLQFSMAYGERNGTLQELYGIYILGRTDNYDYIGNPGLKPERSWNPSVKWSLQGAKWQTETSAYGYFIKDYIAGTVLPGYTPMTSGARGVKQESNLASAMMLGFENLMLYTPFPSVTLSSVNTWLYGRDFAGRALPFIAPFKTVERVQWQHQRWAAFAESTWNSAQNHVDGTLYGETRSPSSWIMNLGTRYTAHFGGKYYYTLGLSVNNLFDRRYYEHLDVMKIYRPGRSLTGQVSIRF